MFSQQKPKKYLETPIIYYPQNGDVYTIKNSFSDTGELTITIKIKGREPNKIELIDLNNLFYRWVDGDTKIYFGPRFIPPSSLPICDGFNTQIPPSVISYYHSKLYALKTCKLIFENNLAIKFSVNGTLMPNQEKYQNNIIEKECKEIIEKECKELAGGTEVKTGLSPIGITNDRPSSDSIKKIYSQFLDFNNDDKLNKQYQGSRSRCFIRAHFVAALLNQYGIHCAKVFKFWGKGEECEKRWKPFNAHCAWSYHVAVMIFTSDNQKLIWDPWVGLNDQLNDQLNDHLLTIKEWLFREDEPKPIKFMICNKSDLYEYSENIFVSTLTNYMQINNQFRIFQFLYNEAVPKLPIEKPLRLFNQHAAFFQKKKEILSGSDNGNRELVDEGEEKSLKKIRY